MGEPHLGATGRHLPYGTTVTCHPTQVNVPRLTPAMQASTRFTYPIGMEGWVDLVDLIAPRPGVKLVTFRWQVWRPSKCTTKTVVITGIHTSQKHCESNIQNHCDLLRGLSGKEAGIAVRKLGVLMCRVFQLLVVPLGNRSKEVNSQGQQHQQQ